MLPAGVTIRYRLPRYSQAEFNQLERQRRGAFSVMFERVLQIFSYAVLILLGMLLAGLCRLIPDWRFMLIAYLGLLLIVLIYLQPWIVNHTNRGREEEVTFFPGRIEVYSPYSGKIHEYLWDRSAGFDETESLFALRYVADIGDHVSLLEEHDSSKSWRATLGRWLAGKRYRPMIVPKRAFSPEQGETFRRLAIPSANDAAESLLRLEVSLSAEEARKASKFLHPFSQGPMKMILYPLNALAVLLLPVYGHLLFKNAKDFEFPLSWAQMLHEHPWFSLLIVVYGAFLLWAAIANVDTQPGHPPKSWASMIGILKSLTPLEHTRPHGLLSDVGGNCRIFLC